MDQAIKKEILEFQKVIGELLYLSRLTRPHVSAAVNILSRFASNPSKEHQKLAYRSFRYLNKTSKECIILGGQQMENLIAFSDADYASEVTNRKSMSGYVVKLGVGPIALISRKQESVSVSTMKAEYIATSECIKDLIWTKGNLKSVGMKLRNDISQMYQYSQ